MAEFTVYGVPGSPYLRSALIGFEEKGISYRLVSMGFGESKAPEHLARHPFGRIPVVDHGNFRLYETQAIIRYLDDVSPPPSFEPRDIRSKARMNQLVGIADFYFFPKVTATISFQRFVVPMRGGTPDEAVIAAAKPDAVTCVKAIEALMGDVYLTGEEVSLADIMLIPNAHYFSLTPEGKETLGDGKLQRWVERMRRRPSFERTEIERLKAAA
ncbi:MAG: glutathione S-transferase family protein [Hyphomicrobiales bacterium]|nr:glutathione S-transferase family protein [Hyphomicrobiales bacterium]MBV8427840.1 glutathione S-transferase family protein [Hyphomicrobiales bacterium]